MEVGNLVRAVALKRAPYRTEAPETAAMTAALTSLWEDPDRDATRRRLPRVNRVGKGRIETHGPQ